MSYHHLEVPIYHAHTLALRIILGLIPPWFRLHILPIQVDTMLHTNLRAWSENWTVKVQA